MRTRQCLGHRADGGGAAGATCRSGVTKWPPVRTFFYPTGGPADIFNGPFTLFKVVQSPVGGEAGRFDSLPGRGRFGAAGAR